MDVHEAYKEDLERRIKYDRETSRNDFLSVMIAVVMALSIPFVMSLFLKIYINHY